MDRIEAPFQVLRTLVQVVMQPGVELCLLLGDRLVEPAPPSRSQTSGTAPAPSGDACAAGTRQLSVDSSSRTATRFFNRFRQWHRMVLSLTCWLLSQNHSARRRNPSIARASMVSPSPTAWWSSATW